MCDDSIADPAVNITGCAVCEVLVGLENVEVLKAESCDNGLLRVHISSKPPRPKCHSCGGNLWSHGKRSVSLVDLCVFGRPCVLVWYKQRWKCSNENCEVGVFTEQNPRIAPPRAQLTTRAAHWSTHQAGMGRSVKETALELGCSWHPVNTSVRKWGQALLDADTKRIAQVSALGLDEHLLWRKGRFARKMWGTSIVDVNTGQLLDIVRGRSARAAARWLRNRPPRWRKTIRWACLDLSGAYRAAFAEALPDAEQVADPFHVVRLANKALDEVRRRVQNETLGHRGRKGDPLWRARKLLVMASERVSEHGHTKIRGLLEAGDPYGEVRDAWHAKENVRDIYAIYDPATGAQWVEQLAGDFQSPAMPEEINQLGRTLRRWYHEITNWFKARVTNGPTEAVNNLIKRVKRVAFGFTNFDNYRIRALLYAGKPDWSLLDTLTP